MKKIIILIIMTLLLVSGCGKVNNEKLIKEFKDDVLGSKGYEIDGIMEITGDEEVFTYKVNVAFKKDDYYRVSLINETNNHEQLILKNKEGVFVVTPSLNKSFKFQSEWPKSSSQAYLLASLVDDLNKEGVSELKKTEDGYEITANVSYPNNPDLTKEKIYFDKNMNLLKVEVLTEEGTVKIKVNFTSIDYKTNFDDDYFDLDTVIDEECCREGEDKETNKLEDIIYPLYVPANTYLTGKDVIKLDKGERVILTFAGDANFILVEETIIIPSELEIIPVYGDPLMLTNGVAALSGNSLRWTKNNIDYYLTSESLNSKELATIAESLENATATIGK